MTPIDLDAVDHLLSTTRAVRRRLDLHRPVGREVIEECLKLAIQAPTGSNSQGWRWVVVTDADKRAALAELYRRVWEPYAGMVAPDASDAQQQRVYSSAAYLAEHFHEVPVHVVPCVYGRPGAEAFSGASLFGSIFPAVWSFQLALRSRGLGSVLTTMHLGHEAEAAALLGIPDNVTQVGLLPVAYFTGDDFKPAQRRPVAELTYWDSWKE